MKALVVGRAGPHAERLRGALVGHGFAVQDADDVAQAQHACDAARFALVVVDWALDPEAGAALCRARSARLEGAAPAVLAVVDGPAATRAALAAGASDVVLATASDAELDARCAVLATRARDAQRTSLPVDAEHLFWALARAQVGTWDWDMRSGLATFSDAVAAMLGVPPGSTATFPDAFLARIPREYHPQLRAAIERAARESGQFEAEHPLVAPDGELRWVSCRGRVARDAAGAPARMVGVTVDITERRRSEAAVRESRERYELLARAINDAVYDWDIAAGTIAWSGELATLFGYPPSEVGRDLEWWSAQVHPEDRARVLDAVGAMLASDRDVWIDEYRFRHADGRYIVVYDRGVVVRGEGGWPTRMIGSMMDVTALREMQIRLRMADRLASIGTLAAGVAHEINNPLAFVLTNVEIAAREVGRVATDDAAAPVPARPALARAHAALGDATVGIERVRRIVRDLRTFSRSSDEACGPVDVRRVVESSLALTRNELRHRARVTTALGSVPAVWADEARLGQVLVNLLVNAAQAIPEGAADFHEVRIASHQDAAGRVVIEVADTGPGIAADALPRIFDPFFTTKPVGVGTGLGLSICHGIVTALGGEITVESAPGRGTVFRVALSAAPTEAPVSVPPSGPPPPASGRRARILVVDDEPMLGRAIERALGSRHDVVALTNGAQALARLRAGESFDLVLCDLMMPRVTGMDLYEALAAELPHIARRVVFISGGTFTPRAADFLARVPNARLEKPFTEEALFAAVDEALAAEPPLSSSRAAPSSTPPA